MSKDKTQLQSSLSKALEEHLSTVFANPIVKKTQEFNTQNSDNDTAVVEPEAFKQRKQHSQGIKRSDNFNHEFIEKLKASFGVKTSSDTGVVKTKQEMLIAQVLEDSRIQQLKEEQKKAKQEKLMEQALEKKRIQQLQVEQEKAHKYKLRLIEEKIQKEHEILEAKSIKAEQLKLAQQEIETEKLRKHVDKLEQLANKPQMSASQVNEIKKSRSLSNIDQNLNHNVQKKPRIKDNDVLHNTISNDVGFNSNLDIPEESHEATLYCGTNKDVIDLDDLSSILYDPTTHMLSTLLMIINEAKEISEVFGLSIAGVEIVIDYPLNTIYCSKSITSEAYINLCHNENTHHKIKQRTLNYDEIRVNRALRIKRQELAHSIEMFIAVTTLLTAQGRLPKDIKLTNKIALNDNADKRYFDLVPYNAEIMQSIKTNSIPLLDIASINSIPQRYVFSFYNIALNLNLLVKADESKPLTKTTSNRFLKGLFKK